MEPPELRSICDAIGKQRLCELLGWTVRTMDRKLAGTHGITRSDAIALRAVVLSVEVVGKRSIKEENG